VNKAGLVDIVGSAGEQTFKEKTNKKWMFNEVLFKP
jgi:hypothetical protein